MKKSVMVTLHRIANVKKELKEVSPHLTLRIVRNPKDMKNTKMGMKKMTHIGNPIGMKKAGKIGKSTSGIQKCIRLRLNQQKHFGLPRRREKKGRKVKVKAKESSKKENQKEKEKEKIKARVKEKVRVIITLDVLIA